MRDGAPTKFSEDKIKIAEDYSLGGWEVEGFVTPTIEHLAFNLEVSVKTIYEWLKQEDQDGEYSGMDRFRKSLEKIKQKQAIIIINKGLKGDFNPVLSKLILSSNHGYKDRSDTTSDDKPLAPGVSDVAMSEGVKKAIEAYEEEMRKVLTK